MALRRSIPALVLAACSGKSQPPAPPPPPPITACGDLAADGIGGIAFGLDEPTVLQRAGFPTSMTAPEERFNPNNVQRHWYSHWRWQAHDLEVTWESLDSATAPRHVDSVAIGPHSDLFTSCGIRIGALRADVERAYQQAIGAWKPLFEQSAAQGFVSAPSDDGTSPDRPIVAISVKRPLLGTFEFENDRLTTVAFMNSAVMFAGQW